MICKRCSFECDMGKYNTSPMNKVWAFRRTPYSLDMCCIFPYLTRNEQRLYFLARSSHTWHNYHRLQFKLQLECDEGWYRYTSHSENHCTECDIACLLLHGWTLSKIFFRDVVPILNFCWSTAYDTGPRIKQNWWELSCLQGVYLPCTTVIYQNQHTPRHQSASPDTMVALN